MVIKLIYDSPVNSKKDIISFLNDHSEVEFKVSEIERLESNFGVKTIENFPQIGPLIAQIYTDILGLAPSLGVFEALDASQQLCEQSLTISRKEIRPLVIKALGCHREALFLFVNESLEAAAQEMRKIEDFGRQIEKVYERLCEHFQSSTDSFLNQTLNMIERHVSFCQRIRELDSFERDAQQNVCMEAYAWASKQLDQTVKLGLRARRHFVSVSSFYYEKQRKCSISLRLAALHLSDVSMLEALLELELDKTKDSPEVEFLRHMVAAVSLPEQKTLTLSEALSSMKTGRSLFSEKPQEMTRADLHPLRVREAFEMSYLRWLRMAKVSFESERIFKETINSIEQAKQGIAWTHKDPLAIALNSSPDW